MDNTSVWDWEINYHVLDIDIIPYFALVSYGAMSFEVSDSHGYEGALLKSPSNQTAVK